MVQYKLYYFDVRMAAEPIRLLLNYVKQPFEDIRIDFKEWPKKKSVPVLEIDGQKRLAQSVAILRYLGGKHGLAGKDEWERAKVNELVDFYKDLNMPWVNYFRVKNGFRQGDAEQLRKEFVESTETNFPLIVKLLNESGSGFFMAFGLTIVDFLFAEYFYTLKKQEPELLEKFPEFLKFVDRIYALPQLKEYIGKRKDTNI